MNEQLDIAIAIILKSAKSGKLLSEFKLWDNLDYDVRMEAITLWKIYKDDLKAGFTLDQCQEMASLCYEDIL